MFFGLVSASPPPVTVTAWLWLPALEVVHVRLATFPQTVFPEAWL